MKNIESFGLTKTEFYSMNREERGKLMYSHGYTPRVKQEQVFFVPSQFIEHTKYKVIQHYDHWTCSCPDFHYRHESCKHIHLAKYWLSLREYLTKTGIYSGTENIIPTCHYCNSAKVSKFGKRKNKQRFKCETCGKTFVENPEFKGLSVKPETIVLTLDLFFKGLSLRKIQSTLKQFHKVEVSHETIRYWKNRFMKQINSYLEDKKPELKGNWHTDETKVKSKKKWLWVWNTIDKETRFLLASNVSEDRSMNSTRTHFQQARENNSNIKPNYVITDGLGTYPRALKKEFHTIRGRLTTREGTRHIRSVGFYKNQLIERHHSTQKERIKIMRGLADRKSLERHTKDYRTYYNFVRENQALENKTPAEKAGINLEFGNNKWIGLIKNSSKN